MPPNVHNAHSLVKAKRTPVSCFMHIMSLEKPFDDRPKPAQRLQQAREAAGFTTAKAAALRHGWSPDTYHQHENGQRGINRAAASYAKAYKVSQAWLLTGEGLGPGKAPPPTGYDQMLSELQLDQPDVAELVEHQIKAAFELGQKVIGERKKQ